MVTMSTPNGQKVQIMLEELHDVYGTEWTYSLMYYSLPPISILPPSPFPPCRTFKAQADSTSFPQQHHVQ